MILPTKDPLKEKLYDSGYDWYAHATQSQEDGRIALFTFQNSKHKEGWVFVTMQDSYGFAIWEEKDHIRMWDDKVTMEEWLLANIDSNPHYSLIESFGPDFVIADDEEIHAYKYGGILSGRGGWFVVKKDQPDRIIRSKQIWMS